MPWGQVFEESSKSKRLVAVEMITNGSQSGLVHIELVSCGKSFPKISEKLLKILSKISFRQNLKRISEIKR